jgi:hypothetical protein
MISKNKLVMFLGILLIMMTGCDTLMDVLIPVEQPIYVEVGDDYPAYIFPASYAEQGGAEYLVNDDTATYWTPTEADVELAEEAFQAEVERRLDEITPEEGMIYNVEEVRDLIPEYYRHYFGFVQDDQPRIYGVYFCQNIPGWGQALMTVEDGGACVVEFIYDLETDSMMMFMIHGEA